MNKIEYLLYNVVICYILLLNMTRLQYTNTEEFRNSFLDYLFDNFDHVHKGSITVHKHFNTVEKEICFYIGIDPNTIDSIINSDKLVILDDVVESINTQGENEKIWLFTTKYKEYEFGIIIREKERDDDIARFH